MSPFMVAVSPFGYDMVSPFDGADVTLSGSPMGVTVSPFILLMSSESPSIKDVVVSSLLLSSRRSAALIWNLLRLPLPFAFSRIVTRLRSTRLGRVRWTVRRVRCATMATTSRDGKQVWSSLDA